MFLQPIFSSFLFTEIIENINNDFIVDFCLQQQKKDFGRTMTNYGGWQSNDINFATSQISFLSEEIILKMNMIKEELNFKKNTKVEIGNSWININKKNNFNKTHIHALSFFSAVYYVKVPKNSGKLIFENPIEGCQYTFNQFYVEKFNTFNSNYWSIEPIEKQLIIFPSWLKHHVEPNMSNEERISIAINSTLKPLN